MPMVGEERRLPAEQVVWLVLGMALTATGDT